MPIVKFRYRLFPYIYSTARKVSTHDESFMRAMFMDFKNDKNTWHNGRQFMFGKSLLVCPVLDPLYTEEKIVKTDAINVWNQNKTEHNDGGWPAVDWNQSKSYEVYLPQGAAWYDFHTGKLYNGGQTINADAPIAYSPLFVKAGSLLPLAQEMQYSKEKPWDYLTVNVYPGADAEFDLYEDEGDNYNYLDGKYTNIKLAWNDKKQTLTVGAREGSYEGMPLKRTFKVVMPDGRSKELLYTGKRASVKM